MKCPRCSDNLIYDAKKQLLVCRSCGSTFRPKSRAKDKNDKVQITKAQEVNINSEISYTLYTCDSCGAELSGTYETSALGFCPYCGGESILISRISGNRPRKIIPFSRTKEECCDLYMNITKTLPFVPNELKNKDKISEIRGIYVPYNIYHVEHNGSVNAEHGGEMHGSNEYIYSVTGNVNACINVPVDGSVQLDDTIGERVFSYEKVLETEFSEEYLATFYVEMPDVRDIIYKNQVKEIASDVEMKALEAYSKGHLCTDKHEDTSEICIKKKNILLSPMYFLTYKNNNRVCYTVIPGAGEADSASVYAEIPVDIVKYLIFVFSLSAIIWTALSFIPFVPTFKHTVTLGIMDFFLAIAIFLCGSSYKIQCDKLDKIKKDHAKELIKKVEKGTSAASTGKILGYLFGIVILITICFSTITSGDFKLTALIIGTIAFIHNINITKNHKIKTSLSFVMYVMLIITLIIAFFADKIFLPDEVVYPLFTVILAPITICFILMIREFNNACTRPVPHFNRQGGHNETKNL